MTNAATLTSTRDNFVRFAVEKNECPACAPKLISKLDCASGGILHCGVCSFTVGPFEIDRHKRAKAAAATEGGK